MKNILMIVSLMVISLNFYSQNVENYSGNDNKVVVEIDFGNKKPSKIHCIEWIEGMTALTALQHCTSVATHPIKEYIFVSDIDGVKNIPYKTAWYYELNGQKPVLAFRQPVKKGDIVKWIYKEDVCSKTKNE